jgi:5-methyltetrahydropteroyltriglutamate--homocysteine methyltransferase
MTDRISTTHAGSLPRTPQPTRLIVARDLLCASGSASASRRASDA